MNPRRYLTVIVFLSLALILPSSEVRSQSLDEDAVYQRALQYIELRKNDVRIIVIDAADGRAIPHARIDYEQQTHDFILTSRPWTQTGNAEELMRNLGLEYRDIGVAWRQTEPQRGVFVFESDNDRLGYIQRHYPSARIFVWIDGIVPSDPADYSAEYNNDPPNWSDWQNITTSPSAFENYRRDVYDYVYTLVSHYKDEVRIWMTPNELNYMNRFTFYGGQEMPKARMGTLTQAVELDQTVAKAIRDADPRAFIVLGTSTPHGPSVFRSDSSSGFVDPIDFAAACVRTGVNFDAFGLHIYPWNGWSQVDYYQYLQKAQALGKKIFPYEVGYPSKTSPLTQDSSEWKWHDFNEDAQAQWLNYTLAISLGTRNVVGYGYLIPQDQSAGDYVFVSGLGLLKPDGSPKKAYELYKEMIGKYTARGTGASDVNGVFTFRGLSGNYSLNVEAEGYVLGRVSFHVEEGENKTLQVGLNKQTTVMQVSTKTSTSSLMMPLQPVSSSDSRAAYVAVVALVTLVALSVIIVRRLQKGRRMSTSQYRVTRQNPS